MLVCIANGNRLEQMIRDAKTFAITILAEGQEEISGAFAKSGREPGTDMEGAPTFTLATGAPHIEGGIANIDCELHEAIHGGDHTIAVGRVVDARFDETKTPLMYFRRGYRSLILD